MLKPSTKILTAISILAIFALIAYAFPIVKNRYFNKKIDTSSQEAKQTPNEQQADNLTTNSTLQDAQTENTTPAPAPEKEPFVNVTRKDCFDNCKRFSNESQLDYCKNICGLADAAKNSADCSTLSGLKQDYCFKNLAVKNQDFDLCEKISDKGIKKTCIARITEDIASKQMQNSAPLPD